MASNGYDGYGRQYQGLTRNGSPVYLMYPPDQSGRRPNEHTILQYANDTQREAYEHFERTQRNQTATSHQRNQTVRNTGPPHYNYPTVVFMVADVSNAAIADVRSYLYVIDHRPKFLSGQAIAHE
ncbi:MAG: hypothetical protein L6R41_007959 [Letrouitia leprolyta]|nr:MAG: hypothetical protein L6R41_007959 [Letrouitia leprolyta]